MTAEICTMSMFLNKALAKADRILALLSRSPEPVNGAAMRDVAADEIIGQIEARFPDWMSYRDLVDCIDVTLHRLRGGR